MMKKIITAVLLFSTSICVAYGSQNSSGHEILASRAGMGYVVSDFFSPMYHCVRGAGDVIAANQSMNKILFLRSLSNDDVQQALKGKLTQGSSHNNSSIIKDKNGSWVVRLNYLGLVRAGQVEFSPEYIDGFLNYTSTVQSHLEMLKKYGKDDPEVINSFKNNFKYQLCGEVYAKTQYYGSYINIFQDYHVHSKKDAQSLSQAINNSSYDIYRVGEIGAMAAADAGINIDYYTTRGSIMNTSLPAMEQLQLFAYIDPDRYTMPAMRYNLIQITNSVLLARPELGDIEQQTENSPIIAIDGHNYDIDKVIEHMFSEKH